RLTTPGVEPKSLISILAWIGYLSKKRFKTFPQTSLKPSLPVTILTSVSLSVGLKITSRSPDATTPTCTGLEMASLVSKLKCNFSIFISISTSNVLKSNLQQTSQHSHRVKYCALE